MWQGASGREIITVVDSAVKCCISTSPRAEQHAKIDESKQPWVGGRGR